MLLKLKILFFFLAISFSTFKAQEVLDHNIQEKGKALKTLSAGTTIAMADVIWKDLELLGTVNGIDEKPITLMVENLNKVSLKVESILKIVGLYIIAKGLVFKNGQTQTSEVISCKGNNNEPCSIGRVKECIIDHCKPSERFDSDYWVELDGKNNGFDLNYLTEKKRNSSVEFALRLNTEESRKNT